MDKSRYCTGSGIGAVISTRVFRQGSRPEAEGALAALSAGTFP